MILRSALALLLLASAANATDCQRVTHDGQGYTVCAVDAQDDLRLFLTAPDGQPYRGFDRIDAALAPEGMRLGFAMNAGMYHADRSPVGLYREPAREIGRIVTGAGPGNFGMRPNGVFCIGPDSFAVVESRAFAESPPDCHYATQSGPMLVIGGELHPRFLVDATSRFVRNGVGVTPDGQRALFAISDRRVTFHEFARLFRDSLGTPEALYFDGNVSRLHAPGLNRSDRGRPLGPIVGTVVPVDAAQGGG